MQVAKLGTPRVNVKCRTRSTEPAHFHGRWGARTLDRGPGAPSLSPRARRRVRRPAVFFLPHPVMGRRILRLVRNALLVLVALYAACLLGLAYLRFFPPLVTGVQLQRQAEALVGSGSRDRDYRFQPRDQVSVHLRHAVVAAEDTRFFQHGGFDMDCIREQQEQRRRGRAARGCSTITQQLVKNLFFTTHRSWIRKGVEASLTPPAEWILGKERILDLYVNVIEWGPGIFGAEAAARHHFERSARTLTREQAAGLAAVIPSPRTRRPQQMGWYQRIILTRMRQMGW